MPRYQLLLGSHIDRDPAVKRRSNDKGEPAETFEEFDKRSFRYFYWNSPEHCIIDTEDDLEAKHNKPGFEKFRKLTDFVVAKPQEIDDTAFFNEILRRGFPRSVAEQWLRERQAGGNVAMTQDQLPHEMAKQTPAAQTVVPGQPKTPLDASAVVNNREQKVRDALANLNKMNKQGLEQFAVDEEIDITGCKDDNHLRQVIRKHFNGGK